jgi:isoamylase
MYFARRFSRKRICPQINFFATCRQAREQKTNQHGFDNQSGFLKACSQDPVLGTVKLIAAPWDCGPGGYQVGAFPPGWAEWNDRFRDTVREFWKSSSPVRDLAPRLCASPQQFDHQGRRPWACVNFVTAHDGLTLNDLVTYNQKHNEANGEDNKDGSSDNRSWNCGVEGPTDDPAIQRLRERQIRRFLATLLLSQGTPMMLAGDEFGRTQGGNNNAYCQDNEISWMDWNIADKGRRLISFTRKLTDLRHKYPMLRHGRFLKGTYSKELNVKDVTWLNANGSEMEDEHWEDDETRCFGMMLNGLSQQTGIRKRGQEATLLLVFNAHHEAVHFKLPDFAAGTRWSLLIDTNVADGEKAETFTPGETYIVTDRALLLFVLEGAVGNGGDR